MPSQLANPRRLNWPGTSCGDGNALRSCTDCGRCPSPPWSRLMPFCLGRSIPSCAAWLCSTRRGGFNLPQRGSSILSTCLRLSRASWKRRSRCT
eukprot:6531292-Prorocentrum_lima.AAC.1